MSVKYTIHKMRGKRIITHPEKHGKITVVGNGHLIDLQYGAPEWSKEDEAFFTYRGEEYWLSEFMGIGAPMSGHMPEWMREYDGYTNDSFFSGVLIKIGQGDYKDQIKAYTFYS